MIPPPLRPFIHRLLQATNEGEITWREGAEQAYFATQKDANIHLRHYFDDDTGEAGYVFRITRKKGDAFFSVMSDEDDFHYMRNLYAAVTVNAVGGADIVNDLFD